jgi:hypothetical protein
VLPNITTLQSESVEFTNFFVAATACTASRAAFLTGLYPPQTCMYITQTSGPSPALQPGFPTFASYLQSSASYQTAYFGKWHLSDESSDYDDTSLSAYGFAINGNETPSPDGYPDEGMTGGYYANPPQEASATWINDQQIVNNFASSLESTLAVSSSPWCAVVSLINPHDISNYPLYLINYCQIADPSAIQPYYGLQTPGAQPTWASPDYTYPNLPAFYELFNYTAPPTPNLCYDGGAQPLTQPTTLTVGGVAAVVALSSNVAEAQGSPKPNLQGEWKEAEDALFGSIDSPASSPTNGDWGLPRRLLLARVMRRSVNREPLDS